MDLVTGIQKAIDYIEDHILDELDSNMVAKEVNVSSYHFQRIFHILSGFTLGEYIRYRRLSLAASELQSSERKVIDIALKYGYETSESFSRAFERFHGVLPSAAKEKGVDLKSFSRLSIKVLLEGGSVMDYRIEEMNGLRLLGKVERQFMNNVQAGKFWDRCIKDGILDTLTKYSTSPDKEHIGIADGSSYDGESYLYYIVTPYDGNDILDGYIIKELPARTWIKFRCVSFGVENTADTELWRKIYSEFFPTSDYKPAEYQLEVYPQGNPYNDGRSYKDNLAEAWIAVRKKEQQNDRP